MNLTKLFTVTVIVFMMPQIGQCQESGSSTNDQKISGGFTLHNGEMRQITVTTAAMVCARSEPIRCDVLDHKQFVVPPGITVVTAAMVCGNSQIQSGSTHVWQDRQVGNVTTINNYYQQSVRVPEPASVIYEEPSQVYYYGSPLAALEFSAGMQFGGGGYYPPYWEVGNSYNEYNHIANTEYLYGIGRNRPYYNDYRGGNYGNYSYGYGARNFPPVRFLPPVNRAGPIPAPPRGYYGGGHRR